jgi:signal transduction histidine kinase
MTQYKKISNFSKLPIVDLQDPGLPQNGILVKLSDTCRKNYSKGSACKQHYATLARDGHDRKTIVQCPYGFASIEFRAGDVSAAITGFIPSPRLGGAAERIVAKRHKEVRLEADAVLESVLTLKEVGRRYQEIEMEAQHRLYSVEEEVKKRLDDVELKVAQKFSMALHEIRKLNRTVVQTAERMCIQERPSSPESANPAIVTIWKTAEMMSKQFDVIEILANEESLTTLPVKTQSVLYRVFDKCVRAYQFQPGDRRIFLQSPPGYNSRILVCEKTFPIIPTALITNALKYSIPGTEIRIIIGPEGDYSEVTVISQSEGQQVLDDSIFVRGVRASEDKEGTGMGLYVAQLVARQHGTNIRVESHPSANNTVKHIFKIRFRTIR